MHLHLEVKFDYINLVIYLNYVSDLCFSMQLKGKL